MRLPIGQSAALSRPFIDLVPEIVASILRTIELGWELARKRSEVEPNAGEITMTECLRDGMRSALREHNLPWRKTMIIAPGTESRSQAGMVVPDGRTDIPIYLTPMFEETDEHDPHAIAECKRLSENDAALAREYVVEGIDRFRSGKYSENHAHGFMIAYVISGANTGAVAPVNAYLNKQSRMNETLTEITDSAGTRFWTSSHSRQQNGSSITLSHMMLSVQ